MDNLDKQSEILSVLLKHMSINYLIENKIQSTNLQIHELSNMLLPYMKNYSDTEMNHILQEAKSVLRSYNTFQDSGHVSDEINLFDTIFNFTDKILVEQNNEILCKYLKILRWRSVTSRISEETLVIAYLARKDAVNGVFRKNFMHKPVITHNNFQLKAILKEGISENHFHLMGSAPYFQLSWIHLMNEILDENVVSNLRKFEERRRNVNIFYNETYKEDSFEIRLRQAFLIRLYLFARLTNMQLRLGKYKVLVRNIDFDYEPPVSFYENEELPLEKCSSFLTVEHYKELWDRCTLRCLRHLLLHPFDMEMKLPNIQENIYITKFMNGVEKNDYAVLLSNFESFENEGSYTELLGERAFLYHCFRKIRKESVLFSEYESNLFHAYLVIKENIRAEMVQANEYVGFENFQIHQDRKEYFSSGEEFEKSMARMAVRDTILSQNIISLEARVSPGKSAKDNYNTVEFFDGAIDADGKIRDRFFYVFHFIKTQDHAVMENIPCECRHFDKRIDNVERACALRIFREKYPGKAKRVLGIDAASQEIGCRPEVFAMIFRALKDHTVVYEVADGKRKLSQLRATYHVGEDFLDILDGLRAIDEAINFLNLDCGDRLGHALALGVNVEDWYKSKKDHCALPAHDYLDNIVWLYHAIVKYEIEDSDNVKSYLASEFSRHFNQIYGGVLNQKSMNYVLEKVRRRYLSKKKRNELYHLYEVDERTLQIDINTYYKAWQLRGDVPELYKQGFYDQYTKTEIDLGDYSANVVYPADMSVRYTPEVAFLYYLYHYSRTVRTEGRKEISVKIKPSVRKIVSLVQKKMQMEISKRGIGIETNPSSNYMIGTFKRYSEHPITSFYNLGLVVGEDKLAQCPQLVTSINTDDQGVFSSSLENEYALIARALEKEVDDDGNPVYNRTMIYDWINKIRINGNRQSFNYLNTNDFSALGFEGEF